MPHNPCIKTGATVLLTHENLAVRGDLFYVADRDGSLTLALHYVTPMEFVNRKQDDPVGNEYDAIFETEQCFVDFGGVDCLTDMPLAKVMICAPSYCMINKQLKSEALIGTRAGERHNVDDGVRALLGALFGGLGSESSEEENGGTLQ